MNEEQSSDSEVREAASPAALRDMRWIGAVLWMSLLLGLLVTSMKAIDAYTDGSTATRYLAFGPDATEGPDDEALAVAGLALSGLAAAALIGAWFQFVLATSVLLAAYGYSGRKDEEPGPADWIIPGEEGFTRTMLGTVLQYLAAAWGVIIVTPAVLTAVEVFS